VILHVTSTATARGLRSGGFSCPGGNLRGGAAWLKRPPLLLETSVPGVFAAGDMRHRSIKRVASAAGEGATAIHLVHEFLSAGQD
jgi:thioredoxin reductase (NADPH)